MRKSSLDLTFSVSYLSNRVIGTAVVVSSALVAEGRHGWRCEIWHVERGVVYYVHQLSNIT
jgi:hypothetical protein